MGNRFNLVRTKNKRTATNWYAERPIVVVVGKKQKKRIEKRKKRVAIDILFAFVFCLLFGCIRCVHSDRKMKSGGLVSSESTDALRSDTRTVGSQDSSPGLTGPGSTSGKPGTGQTSIENLPEGEQLPTVVIGKDDLFLKPSVSYYHERLESNGVQNSEKKSSGVFDCLFACCVCCGDPCAMQRRREKMQRSQIVLETEPPSASEPTEETMDKTKSLKKVKSNSKSRGTSSR